MSRSSNSNNSDNTPPGLNSVPPGLDFKKPPPDSDARSAPIGRGSGHSVSHSNQSSNQSHQANGNEPPKKPQNPGKQNSSHIEKPQNNQSTEPKKATKQPNGVEHSSDKKTNDGSIKARDKRDSHQKHDNANSGGNHTSHSSKDAKHISHNSPGFYDVKWIPKKPLPGEERVDCLTCCQPIEFYAIGECNHSDICALCTIRRRSLFKEMDCCICKQPLEAIVVNKTVDKFQTLFPDRVQAQTLKESSITINDTDYWQFCLSLFEKTCPCCTENRTFQNNPALRKHVDSVHKLKYCDFCFDHRQCFLSEQKLYTPEQFLEHLAKGDPSIPLKPHPVCEYCHITYFGIADLFKHCEESHFKCFLCERENVLYNYFKDYNHLEKHFSSKHFLCPAKECLDKKFIVFPNQLDLQAHNVAAHLPQEKGSARAARVIQLDFSSDRNDQQHIPRQARPPQMPVFYPDRHRPKLNDEAAINLSGQVDPQKSNIQQPTASNHAQDQGSTAQLSTADRSRNLISNVKSYLNNDAKFNKFRTTSAEFRQGRIDAPAFYKAFINTFGDSAQSTAILDEMIDLLPDPMKQVELKSVAEFEHQVKIANSYASRVATGPPTNPPNVAYTASQGKSGYRSLSSFEEFPSLGTANIVPSSNASFTTTYSNLMIGKNQSAPKESTADPSSAVEAFPSLPSLEGKTIINNSGSGSGPWGSHPNQGRKGKKNKNKQVIII